MKNKAPEPLIINPDVLELLDALERYQKPTGCEKPSLADLLAVVWSLDNVKPPKSTSP